MQIVLQCLTSVEKSLYKCPVLFSLPVLLGQLKKKKMTPIFFQIFQFFKRQNTLRMKNWFYFQLYIYKKLLFQYIKWNPLKWPQILHFYAWGHLWGWGDFTELQIDGTFIEQVFQDSIYNYFPKYEHQWVKYGGGLHLILLVI